MWFKIDRMSKKSDGATLSDAVPDLWLRRVCGTRCLTPSGLLRPPPPSVASVGAELDWVGAPACLGSIRHWWRVCLAKMRSRRLYAVVLIGDLSLRTQDSDSASACTHTGLDVHLDEHDAGWIWFGLRVWEVKGGCSPLLLDPRGAKEHPPRSTDAYILLSRAIEVIPLSVELWLALACLETLEKANGVLNKVRKAVPTSHDIWIAAGRLIEQEAYAAELSEEKRAEELECVDKTLATAVLCGHCQWLKEAERCEAEGAPCTCEAIVSATVAEEEDCFMTWLVTQRQWRRVDTLVLRTLCSHSRHAYNPIAATFGAARLT
ncbi:hypothetical protein F5888DRAFT_1867493 [Russula emetica]|nr:hypothetical protein F5888DRAFT_1867493 [Russula emetica]